SSYLPVHHFAVEVDIEAFDFDLAADAQANGEIDRLQDREGDKRAIEECRAHIGELHQQLVRIAVIEPALAGRIDGARGQHARQHRAESAAHAVYAPGIERVVVA